MLNLKYTYYSEENNCFKQIYNNTIQNKHSYKELDSIKNIVFDRAEEYVDYKYDLANIPISPIVDPEESKFLKSCYTRKPETIIGDICNKIIDQNKANIFCPHCGFESYPGTIDHYLPKSKFPEYSILPLNMIPMCLDCNNKKNSDYYFIVDSKKIKSYINIYFDSFLNVKFLYAEILDVSNLEKGVNFFLQPNDNISDHDFKCIQSHFFKLNLLERYITAQESFFTETLLSLKDSMTYSDNKEGTKKILYNQIQRDYNKLGPNHWKTCIKEAILNNFEGVINNLSY